MKENERKKLHTDQIVQNMKLKQQIESAINDFKNPDLFKAGINLFKTIGTTRTGRANLIIRHLMAFTMIL